MDARRGIRATLVAAVVGCVVGTLAPAAHADAGAFPAGFTERTLAAGLTQPVMAAWAPDGRLFVAQKFGQLMVVPKGSTTPQSLLSFADEVNSASDRGFLGVAVDSQFATQPYVYILYTRERHPEDQDSETQPAVSSLDRLEISSDNRVVSRVRILGTGPSGNADSCPVPASNSADCIPSEGSSHSIGSVRSAPDGTLYVGSGDASGYGPADPQALGTQNEQSMRGKILRIKRDGTGVSGHPFCPGETNLNLVCTKVYAKGLRNPFRFQLLGDGRLSVGDVGWNTTEELDLVPVGGGRNYGWPCYEGADRAPGYSAMQTCKDLYAKEGTGEAATGPNYAYDHNTPRAPDTTTGHSIIAGPEYTGTTGGDSNYPTTYFNRLFFADFVGDGTTDSQGNGVGFFKSLGLTSSGVTTPPQAFVPNLTTAALEKAPSGNLAYVSLGDFTYGTGAVREIVSTQANRAPTASAKAAPGSAKPGEAITFDGSGSSDLDRDTLSYRWDFGDGSAVSTAAKPTHSYARAGCYTARLTVTDGKGGTDTDTVTVSVAAAALSAQITAITTPRQGALTYRAGEPINVTGSASGGTGNRAPLDWDAVLHHGTHEHTAGSGTGSTFNFTTKDDHDSDSYYEIRLTARDQCAGARVVATRNIRPETHRLAIRSDLADVPLSWSGATRTTGWDYAAGTGYVSTVSAPETVQRSEGTYTFTGWSDGGAATHDVTVPPKDLDLVARYQLTSRTPDPVVPVDPGTPTAPAPILPPPTPGKPPVSPFRPSTPTPRDRSAPRVTGIDERLAADAAPTVGGRASDAGGIRRVQVFVAARPRAGGPCRFWSDRTRTLGRFRSCSKPVWMTARLKPLKGGSVAWSVRPWKRPVPGRWLTRVRATDRAGNSNTLTFPLVVDLPRGTRPAK